MQDIPHIVIMTATYREMNAVIATLHHRFSAKKLESARVGAPWVVPEDSFFGRPLNVHVVPLGMYNTNASAEFQRFIRLFSQRKITPSYYVFCGCAGGIDEVSVGDVVVPNIVNYYESGKESKVATSSGEETKVIRRPLQRHRSAQVADASRDLQGASIEWRNKCLNKDYGLQFNVKMDLECASGEKVLASEMGHNYRYIRDHMKKSKIVDMESYGIMTMAESAGLKDRLLVVRGVSDMCGDKNISVRLDDNESPSAAPESGLDLEYLHRVQKLNGPFNELDDSDRQVLCVSHAFAYVMGLLSILIDDDEFNPNVLERSDA